jgi:uncharacterized protein (DUF1800 family)
VPSAPAGGLVVEPAAPPPPALVQSPLNPLEKATHVLNRLAFGPRPGEAEHLAVGGDAALWAFVQRQLNPAHLDDSEVDERLAPLPTLGLSAAVLRRAYPRLEDIAKDRGIDIGNEEAKRVLMNEIDPDQLLRRVEEDLVTQKLVREVESRRQLEEVLLDFWFNHFNVDLDKGAVHWFVTGYERDTLRPHLFGSFRELLGAVAHSPAMLFYLDNFQSVRAQPADPAKPKQLHGLNENYARELMELHTLGVNGGYTQDDVREAARCLTGWSIDQPQVKGTFIFRPRQHDEGPKTVLGFSFPPNGGQGDGDKLLDLLADQPATAHFLAQKLARHFVADEPPASLVDRVAKRYLETHGNLREVYLALFSSPEFWSREAFKVKVKTPLEYAVSSIRALDGHLDAAQPLAGEITKMGEKLYHCQPPTGFADQAQAWVNSGSLVERLTFGLRLAAGKVGGAHGHLLPFTPGRKRLDPSPFVALAAEQLIPGGVSPATSAIVLKELAPETRAMPDGEIRPIDVHKLIGLILGSPEFQRR